MIFDQKPNGTKVLNTIKYQSHPVLWVIILALIVFFLWAANANLDQITRAQGEVIASSRTQVIQSSDGGTIQEILVKEGEGVQKGETLVKFDATKTESSYFEIRSRVAALKATRARLIAEISGSSPKFSPDIVDYPQFKKNQLVLLQKKRNLINEEIDALTNLYKLSRKELQMNKSLLEKGDVSLTDVLKLQRQVSDLQSQIANKKNKYIQDTQAELSKIEEDLAGAEQALNQKKDQYEHVELKSPVNGIVKNIRITTLGGVIRAGEEVMQIVPIEDDLVVEVKIKPSDVAFLKPGLEANVKIDSYDFTRYGSLKGKVLYISPDTLTENTKQGEISYYRMQVKTIGKRFSGKKDIDIEIQTGMTATVEIKTGSNTVLNYLTKPLVKTLNESLGER